MEKTVLIPLADGFEEVEALGVVDVLRRAGARVTTAAVGTTREVTSSHQVTVLADTLLEDCDGPFDLISLPGGIPGANNLAASDKLKTMLEDQDKSGRLLAAICASPAVVLHGHGLVRGRKITCFPSFAKNLAPTCHIPERVVVDGNLVTGVGADASLEYGLKLAELLLGKEAADKVHQDMLIK